MELCLRGSAVLVVAVFFTKGDFLGMADKYYMFHHRKKRKVNKQGKGKKNKVKAKEGENR